jgi:hypothetical protein
MFDGFGATGELPIGALLDADVGATGVVPLYLSEAGHITEPSENPANQYFEARLTQPFAATRSLATRDGFAGRIADTTGFIEAINVDGYFDSLLDRASPDGRRAVVLRRPLGSAFADAEIVFDGVMSTWLAPEGKLRVPLRDNLHRLAVPLQANRYTGAGGVNGGADLAGKPHPIALGKCLGVPLVLVDAANLIYQFSYGASQAVLAVYDSGDLLTESTHYTVDLTNSRITLLQQPVGLITANVQGRKFSGTYRDSTAYIIKGLVEDGDFVGLDPQYLDPQTFSYVESAFSWSSGTVGYWIGPVDRLAIDVIEDLLIGVGGFLDCDPVGQIGMGVFGATWYGATFEIDETSIASIDRVALPAGIDPPNKRRQVEYQRLWTGPQATDLAGVVTAARRSFLALEARTAVATGAAGDSYMLATDPPPVRSFFDAEADAAAFAAFLIEMYGVQRAVYQVTLRRGLLGAFKMNMTGTLRYPAWSLHAGREARVFAITQDVAQGTVTLGLFV